MADVDPNNEDLSSYDTLECIWCDKLCKPIRVLKNKTVVYERHVCSFGGGVKRSFKIDVDGDLIE